MKISHNKKRNTLFLYEALLREYTKSKLNKDEPRLCEIKALFVEYFSEGKILREELKLYRTVLDTQNSDKEMAEKILGEAKIMFAGLNQKHIFQQQSSMIAKINRKLTPNFFSNYVPNYKDVATVHQVFNKKGDIPTRMLMERHIVIKMSSPKETIEENVEKIDKYVIHSFLNSFNKKYSGLLENQKTLLKKFMISSGEDNADFLIFMNDELGTISESLSGAHKIAEAKSDKEILKKLREVKIRFEKMKEEEIDEQFLQKVLKFQKLVHEIEN